MGFHRKTSEDQHGIQMGLRSNKKGIKRKLSRIM